jgi:hypothetical protein
MSRDFNFWAVVIGAILAYAVMIGAFVWIYIHSKKKRDDK